MLNINAGRPSELVNSLSIVKYPIKHVRVNCYTHFWDTDDSVQDLITAFCSMEGLEFLEIIGDSYPNLLDIAVFIEFIKSKNCELKFLKMNIRAPFPGQYRIQEKNLMVNKILYTLFECSSLRGVMFISNEQNKWVDNLNIKIQTLLRNHANRASSQL